MNPYRLWSNYISNISVRRKLNLLTVLIALGVIALSVIAARMQYVDLYETRKESLKAQVEMSQGVLDYYANRAKAGELSLHDAQQQALAALQNMRSNADVNYLNVYNTDYVLLMHPFRADLVGKDMKDFRGEDGVRLYYDQVEAARRGGGYVGYTWAKPGTQGPVAKLAYAGLYGPWNWVVSSGVYMDEVQGQAGSSAAASSRRCATPPRWPMPSRAAAWTTPSPHPAATRPGSCSPACSTCRTSCAR